MRPWTTYACAALLLAACTPLSSPETTREEDQEALARLEAEARALASAGPCARPGDCRAAPVGARACGGPRTHLVYCAGTTDTVALFRKLDRLRRAEEAFNVKHGVFSTCDLAGPPDTELVAGSCRARTR